MGFPAPFLAAMKKSAELAKKAHALLKKPAKQKDFELEKLRKAKVGLTKALLAGPSVVGYFPTREAAIRAIKRHGREINEAHYITRLAIECYPMGLKGLPESEGWFALKSDGGYRKCRRPKELSGVVAFA